MLFQKNIVELCVQNQNFRQVLLTGKNTQIVIMNILSGEEIGLETHPDNDQMLLFVAGVAKAIIDQEEIAVVANDLVVVPAGAEHNFINTGTEDLKIITSYSPPHHPDGLVQATKPIEI